MAVHTLLATQTIHADLDEAWRFFSDPRNLARITPKELGFEIRTKDLPAAIYEGLMITYTVRPLFGIPVTWLSEITHVEERSSFIDEQRVGPYRVWHHEHRFRELGPSQVEVTDRVTYVLPFGPLGSLLHGVMVKPQLNKIFAYRDKVITEIFGR